MVPTKEPAEVLRHLMAAELPEGLTAHIDRVVHLAGLLARHGIDAVVATNTTVSRDAVAGLPHADEAGGLSGAPVFEPSNRVIRALRASLPRDYPIIGVGGIMSADDALAKVAAGAAV